VSIEQNPELALQHLEQRIDTLVQVCQRLHEENSQLKNQQADLVQQRSALMDKTDKAKSRVEAMISRLKVMEI
jgi:cell division protein ZapB